MNNKAFERAKSAYGTGAHDDATMEFIFPQLRESEDERIRKEIIEVLRFVPSSMWEQAKTNYERCFSYLEKQKERKHYWKPTETDVALFNKAVTTNKTLTPTERAQLDIIRSKFGCCRATTCNGIVQKEQKPVDFPTTDEEVKEFLETHPKVEVPEKYKTPDFVFSKQEYESHPIISKDTTSVKPAEWSEDIIQRAIKEVGLTQHQIDWFKTNVFPPKQEWSEEEVLNRTYEEGFNDGLKYGKPVKRNNEDKKKRDWLIGLINANTELSFNDKVNLTRWLEHLTIEKELSKNDERIIDAIMIGYQDKDFRSSQIPTSIGVSKDEVINWLKSLHPSWKPSEEQPEVFDTIAFQKGVKEGKRLMMESAVEGFVGVHLHEGRADVTVNSGYLPKEMGIKGNSKVKIIIVKED